VLRTEGEYRAEGQKIRLLCVAMLSLQPAIRPGHSADLAAVSALLKGAGLPTDDLASASDLHLWVLEAEGDVIGAIAIEHFGASALLRSLVIVPAYRQRGLGHRLVAQLEQDVQEKGVEQLILLTETAESFFRRNGYEVIERRYVPEEVAQSAEFRSLCPASAVCMAKVLNQPIGRRNSDVGANV
jgi:amino-acid N-acetyltransferase